VAFDNFATGWREAVKFGPSVEGDLMNPADIAAAFAQYRPVAVMHFAALSLVGESMSDPAKYWRVNVNGALNLINLRGMEVVGNTVYLANAGAGFGKSIVTIDATTAAITGSFAIASNNSPWDIKKVGNELFISNYETGSNSTSRVDRYSLAGSFLGNVITTNNASSGLAGPQQITLKSNGNLLIGGFSGTTNTGIYEYTTSGTFVNFFAGGLGQRGAQELGDGNVLFTKGDGVFVYNVGDNIFSPSITGANSHYINPTNLPAPGAMGVLALAGLAAARRRRA
jgi:hypothetical protein